MADDGIRNTALNAMQLRAGELLRVYEDFEQRGEAWESMALWRGTLVVIQRLPPDSVLRMTESRLS